MVPSLKYPVDLQPEQLTRDKDAQQAWLDDPMIEKWVKAVSAFGPLEGGKDIVANKWRNWDTSKPLLIAHGEDDGVTSCKASKEVVEKIKGLQGGKAEYRGFEGGKHELMLEVYEDVQSEVSRWQSRRATRTIDLTPSLAPAVQQRRRRLAVEARGPRLSRPRYQWTI